MAKAFDEKDVADAIEIRGTLEGLAVRLAAERGVAARTLAAIHDCLAELDVVTGRSEISGDDFSAYVELNGRLHALL
ncbi:FCD domain-containing protein, partial [Acinetobacter baumannii]